MNSVKSLWLVWRNELKSSYYHVGTLSYYNNQYEFSYTHNIVGPWKLNDALNNGYMLHPAFPDPYKVYKSKELFAAFNRRLPSEIREDFTKIIGELKLDINHTKMDLLQETRGQLANDPYSFERPLRVEEDGMVHTQFYIHGMRFQELPSNWANVLKSNKNVYLKQEYDNKFDPNAVAIYSNNLKLGFVPRFYSKGIFSLLENGAQPLLTIGHVNELAPTNWWVKLNFISEIPKVYKNNLKELTPFVELAVV